MNTYRMVIEDGNGVRKTVVSEGKTYLETVSRLKNRFGKVKVVSAELVRVN